MKILIVGSDLNSILLAKYIKVYSSWHDIYITIDSENNSNKFYTAIGIKENDINGLCDFVKYNQIELTIVLSNLAIINAIADVFTKEGFPIVAPFSEAARVTFFNSISKKVMYKLKIPTSRFGIFDRENIALDYIRNARFPLAIMNDFTLSEHKYDIYYGYKKAKLALQKIFENVDEKIVIENFIDTIPIYMYFLTDGYNALPLIALEREEYDNFTQIVAPARKITNKLVYTIMNTAIFPLLDDISKYEGIYSGILGVKLKLQGNNFYIIEYYNGFQSYDMQAFLSLQQEDLIGLFSSVINRQIGKRRYAQMADKSSYTLAIRKKEISQEQDIEEEDLFISEDEKNIIFTKTASTLNFARQELDEYLETNCKESIVREIKNIKAKEVLRV